MSIPNWKLERYLLGELPEREMAELKTLENKNIEFCSQLALLRNSNEELLAEYPAKEFAEKTQAARWLMPLSACAGLLIAATVLINIFPDENNYAQNAVINEDGTRVKGLKTDLEIWRKTTDSVEKLSNESEAKAGDLLQMRYIAEEKCYGVLLSIDGNKVLTIHLSGKNGRAKELEAGRIISLENSYELDNAPKSETFYLFTSKNEFALAPIAEALLSGKMPKSLQVSQITIKKR
ncbi:MAG: hypothetical protein LBC64_00360 [Fibromonadaceae bacterium]|jgi:hypothetical protein|nr:hypothetical protein [Fibromonadaceae bacterium]